MAMLGEAVPRIVWSGEGTEVTNAVVASVGEEVGTAIMESGGPGIVGLMLRDTLGESDSNVEGGAESVPVGLIEGASVEERVGHADGEVEGDAVGLAVGETVRD